VAGVVGRRERPLEPALIEAHPVGVDGLDKVPGVAQLGPQGVILAQAAAEVLDRHRADRLVGVRAAEDERLARPASDGQQVDRVAAPRLPDGAQAGQAGELRRQPAAGGIQFIDGQEVRVIGDITGDRLQIHRDQPPGMRSGTAASSLHGIRPPIPRRSGRESGYARR